MILLSRYVVPAWMPEDDGELLRRWYDAMDRPWSMRAGVVLEAAALEELT